MKLVPYFVGRVSTLLLITLRYKATLKKDNLIPLIPFAVTLQNNPSELKTKAQNIWNITKSSAKENKRLPTTVIFQKVDHKTWQKSEHQRKTMLANCNLLIRNVCHSKGKQCSILCSHVINSSIKQKEEGETEELVIICSLHPCMLHSVHATSCGDIMRCNECWPP